LEKKNRKDSTKCYARGGATDLVGMKEKGDGPRALNAGWGDARAKKKIQQMIISTERGKEGVLTLTEYGLHLPHGSWGWR